MNDLTTDLREDSLSSPSAADAIPEPKPFPLAWLRMPLGVLYTESFIDAGIEEYRQLDGSFSVAKPFYAFLVRDVEQYRRVGMTFLLHPKKGLPNFKTCSVQDLVTCQFDNRSAAVEYSDVPVLIVFFSGRAPRGAVELEVTLDVVVERGRKARPTLLAILKPKGEESAVLKAWRIAFRPIDLTALASSSLAEQKEELS